VRGLRARPCKWGGDTIPVNTPREGCSSCGGGEKKRTAVGEKGGGKRLERTLTNRGVTGLSCWKN